MLDPRRVTVSAPAAGAVLLATVFGVCIVVLRGKYALDLDVYRAGGRALRTGHALYDARVGPYGFTYPPFAATLFTGFAGLSLGAGTALLTCVSVAALAIALWLSVPALSGSGWARVGLPRARDVRFGLPAVLGLAVLAGCEPVRATLWNGQINLVLMALVLLDLRIRWPGRGIGVGLAAAIKLTPAIFVVYLLARRRYADAARAAGAFVVVTAGTWLVLRRDSARFWRHELFAGSGIGDASRPSNQSLYALALRTIGSAHAGAVWAALVPVVLAVGITVAVRLARAGREPYALGVVGITGCLMSPVSWSHHWVWCIPWLVGLAESARRRGTAARVWVAVAGFVFGTLNLVPYESLAGWTPVRVVAANEFVGVAVLTAVFALCVPGSRRPSGLLALPRTECQTRIGTRLP